MFFLFPPFLSRKSNARTREPAWLEKKSFDRTRHFQRNLPEIEEKWFSCPSIGGNNRTSSGFTCLAFDNLPQSLSLPLLDRILFEHDPIERAHQYQIAHTSPPKTLSSQKRSISFVYLFYRAVLYTHFQIELFRPRFDEITEQYFAYQSLCDNDISIFQTRRHVSFRIHFSLLFLPCANLANFIAV